MGLGLGQSYPDRIVDHVEARKRALAAFGRMNDDITL
jgi:deoxyribodipyrimidine photolyase